MPLQFTVDRSQAGCRLDRFLAEVAPEMSRRRARRLISDGCVFVGGARVRVQSRPLPAGSVVTFEEPAGVVQETQPAARSPIPRLRRGPVVGAAKPSFMPTDPLARARRARSPRRFVSSSAARASPSRSLPRSTGWTTKPAGWCCLH